MRDEEGKRILPLHVIMKSVCSVHLVDQTSADFDLSALSFWEML